MHTGKARVTAGNESQVGHMKHTLFPQVLLYPGDATTFSLLMKSIGLCGCKLFLPRGHGRCGRQLQLLLKYSCLEYDNAGNSM